jgi:hypothetical protein
MTEPLFFDCLTDAQFWSLFDSGVLQGTMLPGDVYERLDRLAPAHGCFLFIWPADRHLPSLHEMAPSLAALAEETPAQPHSHRVPTHAPAERIRSEIELFCEALHTDTPPDGSRIHVITMTPHLGIRAGPYLEPPARDLAAMSLPELEAYLDAVLRVEE